VRPNITIHRISGQLRLPAFGDVQRSTSKIGDHCMRFLALLVSLLLGGCGSMYSTLQAEGSSKQIIYELPEEQAFQVAFGAITQVFPGYEIIEIDGPLRGYTTTFRFVLDTYTQQVMVVPAVGKAVDGRAIHGYYFEVSGRGSSVVQGRVKNAELFDTVSKAAQATNKAIAVSELSRASYAGARWKQGEKGPTKRAGESEVFSNIERLKQLRDSGAITDEEFARKRKELLDRL
jgi:Short C-terminal domain